MHCACTLLKAIGAFCSRLILSKRTETCDILEITVRPKRSMLSELTRETSGVVKDATHAVLLSQIRTAPICPGRLS
jgi:hypothetical protein